MLISYFAMSKDKLVETSSYSTTSFTSEEDNEYSASKPDDDVVDPLIYGSPQVFRGTYELMVKDLLGINKVMVEALKDVAKGAPLNLNTWRHMKSRLMLRNDSAI